MIQVENISKSFGEQLLYNNLSLSIQERSRIALIAVNGAGKTTLLNIIAKVEEPDKGDVVYQNDIKIGYLSQKPAICESLTVLEAIYHSDNDVSSTVREYEKAILEGDDDLMSAMLPKMDSLNAWDFEHRAKEILSRLKITNLNQIVATLSGGQLKRVALAIVLINDPDVLILDEPTNHLDLEMSAWLEEYLIKRDKTLLMVTHDRYFLERVCTNIYELDHCQLFQYKGSYNDYLTKRNERIEQFNTEVDKAQNLYRKELEWMRRMPQARGHKAKYREDAFYDIKDKAFQKRNDATIEIALGGSRLGTKIFEMIDVSKSFGEKVILDKFNYTFSRYEKLGIIGNNGTGKSTFLKILTGVTNADSGITDIGESIKFGYFKQDGVDFDENKRVIDVVKDIAEVVTLANGNTITASQLLTHFLFAPEVQYNYVYKLSGGEKRKLYLLTILMGAPNFLILDEPTNDLDIVTLNILEDFLSGYGGCLIVVSHDRYFMDKVVDHLLVFEGNGKLRIFEGNYTQYRNAEYEKLEQERKAEKPQTQQQNKPERPKNQTRKLSYKEKLELEQLDKEIPELESKKSELEAKMSEGTLSADEIMELSKEYELLNNTLDEKSFRWLELSDI